MRYARLLAVLGSLLVSGSLVRAQQGLVATTLINENWHVDDEHHEAIYTGRPGVMDPKLELNLGPVRQQPLTLVVQTDARNLVVQSENLFFEVRLRGRRGTQITFDANADRPTVIMDEQDVGPARGPWLGICTSPTATTFTLRFPKATYANIKFAAKEASKEETKAVDTSRTPIIPRHESTPRTDATATTATEIDPVQLRAMLAKAQQAVIRLEVTLRNDKDLTLVGNGVIIGDQGLAVVPAHLLQVAASARATMTREDLLTPGQQTSVDFDLMVYAIRPDLDLALVQLVSRDIAEKPALFPALDLASAVPPNDTAVWTVGTGVRRGSVISQGKISDARRTKSRRGEAAAAWPAQWLTVDAGINAQTAGGAVVDAQGQLVGLGVWTYNDPAQGFFVQPASMIRDLQLTRAVSAVGLDHLADITPPGAGVSRTFPRLVIRRAADADRLIQSAVQFNRSRNCGTCGGTGLITVARQVAQDGGAGQFRNIEIQREQAPCPRCEGKGIARADHTYQHLIQATHELVAVDTSDPRYDQAMVSFKHVTGQAVDDSYVKLDAVINADALPVLQAGLASIGKAAAVTGLIVAHETPPGETQRMLLVQLDEGTSRQSRRTDRIEANRKYVLISSPLITSLSEQPQVLAGGVLAGYVDHHLAGRIPVLLNGFAISPAEKIETPTD